MIPIYSKNATRVVPWITLALLVANVTVFGYELSLSAEELSAFVTSHAVIPAEFFAHPASFTQLVTLLVSSFIHAGWIHLLGNMLYLWVFGTNVEARLGRWRFMLLYLLAAVVAAFAQAASDPTSTAALVGASGAIAGVLGAYVVLFPRTRVITLVPVFFYVEIAALPAVFVIGMWFALQLVEGLASVGGTVVGGGIAWWAHIAGFAAGMAIVSPLAASDTARAMRTRSRSKRGKGRRQ